MSRIVWVLGPPAVGKTTALQALERRGIAILPARPEENPHFATAWTDRSAAYASQRWFVSCFREPLLGGAELVVVEDDPRVATAAHARSMERAGLLSAEQVAGLAAMADRELRILHGVGRRWRWALLDADDDVLLARSRARIGAFDGDAAWLASIAADFRRAHGELGGAVLRTDRLDPERIATELARLAAADQDDL